jgi:MFS family permease
VTDVAATFLPKVGSRRIAIAVCAAMVAFLAYSSVYAFRKPFTVATFDGVKYWGMTYQTLLIISQVIGYMLSKFYGIKFISELKTIGRFKTSVVLTGCAWLSLLFFGLVPAPFGMIFLFINGFMLGFMWGMVFSYLEGRRATDFIGAVMAVSFIFAGGFTRSVAKWLMVEWSISETWMPFMTGLVFALPLLFFLWLLEKIPAPDETDIKERTIRLPMDKESRKKFLKTFGPGLGIVTVTYLFLTVMRDVRDNYMANIWNELGYGNNYSIFTKTETNTSLIILLIMGMLVVIRKNIRALSIVHFVIGAGLALAGISSLLFITGKMDGPLWMQLTGLGLYMGYIPFNCIFFERLIASFRIAGNVGFLIYFADAFGYLGSVIVMLSKEFMPGELNWSQFYSQGVVVGSVLGLAGTIFSWFYFNKKYSANKNIS